MIKADQLISSNEIEFVKLLCQKYAITSEMRETAMELSLQESMEELMQLPAGQQKTLFEDAAKLTLSDGTCCREEALLLLAMHECMNTGAGASIVSVPWGDIMLDNSQVLFVENGYDTTRNEAITTHYTSLYNSFRVGGFDFVYMPKVVEQLTATENLLNDIVFYLAPTGSDAEADAVAQSIRTLTTESLYRELLIGKLGFNINLDEPSFVMRIGFSMVNNMRMANYLVVPLTTEPQTQVNDMMTSFMNYQNQSSFVIRNCTVNSNTFVYAGFYRTLFDLVTYRQGASCTLQVHPYNHKNVLSILTVTPQSETDVPVNIGPKEAAFYIFLIDETINYGGFPTSLTTAGDATRMKEAQKRFEKTYFSLCNRETAPDITNADIRRPMLSKIRKAIELHPTLVQKMMFLPETTTGKVIKVHVEKRNIVTEK
jgi:hypothetical protein